MITPTVATGSGATIAGAEAVYWHDNDHLGTPKAMTDINGTKVWEMQQTPFGIATVNEDPDGNGIPMINNFHFPGQYFDAETGLNYNYYRTYDPYTGRYTQADPIGLDGGMNGFGYVGGRPVTSLDPTGLSSQDVNKIIIEALKYTEKMTREGKRRDPGYLNNLYISCDTIGLCDANSYNGCGEQARQLKKHLEEYIKNNPLDDKWQFDVVFTLIIHFNLEAKSLNSSDPTLTLDPHRNKFGVYK